jgi:hypothetical protein
MRSCDRIEQSGGAAMSTNENGETCYFCNKGKFVTGIEEIAFHQWTDKGYVFCRVTLSLGVCDHCGSRHWTEEAEAALDEAIRRESAKLPG